MSDYPMLISNKLHYFRNFTRQKYESYCSAPILFVSENPIFVQFVTILTEILKDITIFGAS